MLSSKAWAILEEMAQKFSKIIPQKRLVVGLSGGADSTLVLLLAIEMRKLNPDYQVVAVHCIHGLDADDPIWLAHCTALCKRVQVDEFITPKLNIVYGNGLSPEAISREERYRALKENLKGGVLLIGHQADDEVENFLLALKRGSGPEGLSGMSECITDSRGIIIRPCLKLHKQEIEELVTALGFDYVYDISNSYLKFERNFMRLKVLPLLRERFVGIDKAILRSSHLCELEHDLAMRYVKDIYAKVKTLFRSYKALDLKKLNLDDEAAAICVLRCFLAESLDLNPEFRVVEEALRFAHTSHDTKASLKLNAKLYLKRYLDYLVLVPTFTLPVPQQYELQLGQSLHLGDFCYSLKESTDKERAFMLKHKSVILDFNYQGSLKLKPVSRHKSRELKKLMGEYQIPLWERGLMCVVYDLEHQPLSLANLCALGDKDISSGYELSITKVQ